MNIETARQNWTWEVPEFLNIGAACTDRHLGTPAESRLAMVVEDADRGGLTDGDNGNIVAPAGRH